MDETSTVEGLRRQMAEVRGQLGGEVAGIVDNARQLTDWRYYVQTFPWVAVAASAAVGYIAVPRRLEIISPDVETLEKLAKNNRLVVNHYPKGTERPSAAASLVSLTGNMLLRAGMAYVGHNIGKVFGEQAAESPIGDKVAS